MAGEKDQSKKPGVMTASEMGTGRRGKKNQSRGKKR